MKYIIFQNDNGLETALIFPNHIPHVNMANDTVRQIAHWAKPNYKCPKIGKPISAGFIRFDSKGFLFCEGNSDSLDLDSRPDDIKIIINEMNRSAYYTDPLAAL